MFFLVNDMQTLLSRPLNKSRFLFLKQKVAQCSEKNEKLIFRFLRFLVFEMWSFKIIFFEFFFVPEDEQCSGTNLTLILTILQFLVREIWSILYFNF